MCKTREELNGIVADYRSLKAMKEELEDNLKTLEMEIYGYMDFHQKTDEVGNDYTIKISECERSTLDKKRLEADLGSLEEYYKTSHYRRLSIR